MTLKRRSRTRDSPRRCAAFLRLAVLLLAQQTTSSSKCRDLAGWKSRSALGCTAFVQKGWCDSGKATKEWENLGLGTFADWADMHGISASQACCECGGGAAKWRKAQAAVGRNVK